MNRALSAAAERNRGPILQALRTRWTQPTRILEIASGTGQHGDYFTEHEPHWIWQPTEAHPEALEGLKLLQAERNRANFLPPLALDVSQHPWPVTSTDRIFCANLIHISPWECTLALFRGAAQILGPGGQVVLYGPFRESGVETAPSNEAFDQFLRSRDSRWGLRDRDKVDDIARSFGYERGPRQEMPANNLLLSWEKRV